MGFAKNFTRLQQERKETNCKTAQALGISQTTIANWKDGTSRPRNLYLESVAQHFGCNVDDLLKEEDT